MTKLEQKQRELIECQDKILSDNIFNIECSKITLEKIAELRSQITELEGKEENEKEIQVDFDGNLYTD